MTRKEFFEANPNATFEDYGKYLTVVILLIEHLGRLPTEEEIEEKEIHVSFLSKRLDIG